MTPNILLLGGTTEAASLARALAATGLRATVSLAGRVARPAPLPLPLRVGGFGGVAGLVDHLRAEGVTHAAAACAETGVPLIALTRAEWRETGEDRWIRVPDMAGAVAALDRPAARVFLAVGRMHLAAFAARPQHDYLLRLVDAPDTLPPLPRHRAVIDRGPFGLEGDLALMREHGTGIVVSKNAGGTGAFAKIAAARALGLPVIMIDRPAVPPRPEAHTPEEVMRWLGHGADLGV
ncbi:cobalt-precorrin-6A reductase [Salipiger sp. HF18]|uniref:cobalt-precorrin-6A reductase n=1 Tax=Salipiger sp. HF18 TaxID=2721557 RepID=UPI00142D6711|nr:cobalt-precorrin-6A reductase [Salipiger sp. HF18]NIY97812.1 cobalt-precorrin-6A reductase [Salipiger sp. HF18]